MKMEYKLFDEKGVILTRQPTIVEAEDEMIVFFFDAPANATAIFETADGREYYRILSEGLCSISIAKIFGEIKVTVAVMGGDAPSVRWLCEEINIKLLEDGKVLISPNDMNLPQKVVDLQLENQEIKEMYRKLEARYEELNGKLDKIMEGYDVT